MKIIKFRCIIFILFLLIISLFYGNTGISFSENCNDEIQNSIFRTSLLFAQQEDSVEKNAVEDGNREKIEDTENQESVLFTVMIIIIVMWIGISIYLFLLNKKVSSLEKKIDEL